MSLDAAVYADSQDKIYGVRAGFVYRFNADTGAKESVSRFTNLTFGRSCLLWSPAANKLFSAGYGDWSFAYEGVAPVDYNVVPTSSNRLYQIDPGTLTVDADYGWKDDFAIVTGLTDWPILFSDGVYDMVYYNGDMYIWLNMRQVAPYGSWLLRVNTLLVTDYTWYQSGVITSIYYGSPGYMAVCPSTSPARLYIQGIGFMDGGRTYWNYIPIPAMGARTAAVGDAANNISGIVYSAVNDTIYQVLVNGTQIVKWSDLAGTAVSFINIGQTAGMPFRLRYNDVDSMIYIPCPATNAVVRFDPSTDTVNATYTGLDSPVDVVFTPTKVFAVQSGAKPLQLLS